MTGSDTTPARGAAGGSPGLADRPDGTAQGHWLLARLGKRVLRPGGAALTATMLERAGVRDADAVEFAPGLGRTAAELLAGGVRSYVGVDADPDAARAVGELVAARGRAVVADAARTGLPDACADVVVGEAMLTMQDGAAKDAIVAEAVRLLRPGGRYAIHELGLTPDDLADDVKDGIRQALARTIRVNARPQTIPEWSALLEGHGLVVEHVETAPMALLQPRRLVADEGLRGALRFAGNLLRRPEARRRVLAMRRTFRAHRRELIAVALVARRPG